MKTPTILSMTRRVLLPMALLSVGLAALPAYANHFSEYGSNTRRNVASAGNPSADDIRGYKYYPKESLSLKEEGKVGLKVSLTEEGKVIDAVVVKSSGSSRLDNAAIQALKGDWRYDPPEDGLMPASLQTEVVFNLEEFP